MKRWIVCHALSLIAIATFMVSPGQAAFADYDDFADVLIDHANWNSSVLLAGQTLELIREIEDGRLHLHLRAYGNDTSDAGTVLSRLALNVRQLGTPGGSGFITGLRARMRVRTADVQNCPANPDTGNALVRLTGFFFNDGTVPESGAVGNIVALLGLVRDSTGANTITGSLRRCTASDCNTTEPVGPPAVTFATSWSLNVPVILRIVWAKGAGKVKFDVNPGTPGGETQEIVYASSITDAGPPKSFDSKQVGVNTTLENCDSAAVGAVIDALIDNVKVQRAP